MAAIVQVLGDFLPFMEGVSTGLFCSVETGWHGHYEQELWLGAPEQGPELPSAQFPHLYNRDNSISPVGLL